MSKPRAVFLLAFLTFSLLSPAVRGQQTATSPASGPAPSRTPPGLPAQGAPPPAPKTDGTTPTAQPNTAEAATLDTARQAAIAKKCGVDKAKRELNLPALQIAKACYDAALAADAKRAQDLEDAKKIADALTKEQATGQAVTVAPETPAPTPGPPPGPAVPIAPQVVPQQKPAVTPANGDNIQASVYKTPSACDPGPAGAALQNGPIAVRRELLAPKEASDIYGYRLGKHYIIYQVRVTDQSKDFQYIAADITVDLKNIFTALGIPTVACDKSYSACLASSRELSLLRGVPEKGQDYDPRNMTLHILQGVGSVAGGVSGLTAFSDVMGAAVANFNGAFLQAFVGIAPDHTGTQLNRLSDAAFSSNTLVDRLHTKVFAVFIPEALIFHNDLQRKYWSSPRRVLDAFPLDQVNVCVDGNLVTEVSTTAAPIFSPTTGNISQTQMITLAAADPTAVIYYTTNGQVPTATSTKYTAPFQVNTSLNAVTLVQAIAITPNKLQSPVAYSTFTTKAQAATPTFAPIAGVLPKSGITITTTTPGATLYYTIDGSDPSTSSTLVTGPVSLTKPGTIKAIATSLDTAPSGIASATYTAAPAGP
jgi:hypothetical protein